MTFLNPFVLFGLAAAAIPVLLHLLNLRKLRTIDFSSLRFLKELQRTSMRRVRFRQILLLILRTLLIIVIVLAFSRPALRGSVAGLGRSDAPSTMVVIVDDSPSMGVRDERGTAFSRAQQAAAHLIDLAASGDKLYLVPLSELGPGSPRPTPRTVESARSALSRMALSPVSVSWAEALTTIAPLLGSSTNANREVMLVTDGQATGFPRKERSRDSAAVLDAGVRLFVISSPPLRHDNAAVGGAEVLTRLISERKPVQLRSRIDNFSEEPLRGSLVSVYTNGARVAQQSLDIPARGNVQEEFSFNAKRRGISAGSVTIEDDILDADNSFYFTLNIPEHSNVLLAGADANATRLATLALTLSGDSLLAGQISARAVSLAELSTTDLSRFDVLLLCGSRGLSPATCERIARFVRDGGGVLLFPGADTAKTLPESMLLQSLGLPLPLAPPVTQGTGTFLTFGKIDFAHPLFQGMFEKPADRRRGPPAVDPPRIVCTLPLRAGEKGVTVISLSNGNPFLIDVALGAGRVLLFAIEAGTSWSDFPLKGLYAPLLHRSVMYLCSRTSPLPPITSGDPLRFSVRLRDFKEGDTYTVTRPDGTTERVAPSFQPSTGQALFDGGTATEPGVYTLARDARAQERSPRDLDAVAANISPGESDLRTITTEGLEEFSSAMKLEAGQIRLIAPEEDAPESVRQARYGLELSRYFLMVAVMLALVEMAVGRATRRAPQEAVA